MWYNIIPSFSLVVGALGLPAILIAGLHKLAYDNLYKRELINMDQRFLFLRDERLTGNAYKAVGLEGIPDEEPSE
ncbi:uncharacterized protein ND-MWFE [Cherax quadricarinatus]|uniref:uncharacterized protein ND-MWFE n=1 Tax=Cherax quadricarinatus TaxID=27406 RepID=UPI00387E3D4D